MLDKFNISIFTDKELQQLTASKIFFETLEINNDKRINKTSKKKTIIDDVLCLFAEHLTLGDVKIKFSSEEDSDEFICINNIDDSYLSIVETLLRKCIKRYFMDIDSKESIDDDSYRLVKLSLLNNDEELIKRLTDQIINELFVNTEYEYNFTLDKISKTRIIKLADDNSSRNKKLLEMCKNYQTDDDLFPGQIRTVFACLSSDVFNRATIKEKIHLMNLVYNYFSYHKDDKYSRYKKVVNNEFNNIDALNYVLYDLSIKDGNNYLNKFRNEKLLEDVKSGFKYIIRNETIKSNVRLLDDVSIKNMHKK